MEKPQKRRWDALLIGGCLLLAAALFLLSHLGREAGAGVIIRINGEEAARYGLYDNGVYSLNGGTNTLVIRDGRAWLSHADCPDLLCVRQGKISSGGQVITCLPNRLTVTVYGADDGVDIG